MRHIILFIATVLSIASLAQTVQTKVVENGGTGPYSAIVAKDASLPDFAIYRPKDLKSAALAESKLPIVLFANGACVNSSLEYERLFNNVASYGYVIIAIGELQMTSNSRPAVEVDASLLLDALHWITDQAGDNSSEYYNRVDIDKISASGHSCGGAQVISLAENPAFKSYMILNSGMGDMNMAGATPASLQNYHAPVLYMVGGESDVAYSNALLDYSRIDHIAVTLANLINGGHSGTFWDPYGGSNSQMMLKWLDWHFKNATDNCAVFLEKDLSEFPGWELFSKNYGFDCSSQPSNGIKFSSPATGNFAAPATITFDVDVSAGNNDISKILYYLNDELIQEKLNAPYAFDYTIETAGDYTVRAVATDNEGKTSQATMTLRVNVPQGPYEGTAWAIPGTVELEKYDVGGNGFAYFDTDEGNSGGAEFRTNEDVDIEVCTDEGDGYNLGWSSAGEWLEYTVNVQTSGIYSLTFRAACNGDGRTVSLGYSNGTPIVPDIAIPNTEDWQTWTDVLIEGIELRAGKQVLRLTVGSVDYVNLNNMTFNLEEAPTIIQLREGWNLIGYPFLESNIVENAFRSIQENLLYVKDFDGFYDANGTPALNSLTDLEYGKGYFVKVDADCYLEW